MTRIAIIAHQLANLGEKIAYWATVLALIVICAAIMVSPYIFVLIIDRTPPLILHDGKITESLRYNEEAHRYERWRGVVWRAHRRRMPWYLFFEDWDCPGLTQREITHARTRQILPVAIRGRKGVFHPDKDNPYEGTVSTPPFLIGAGMEPGDATYQVTQYYSCNWLQDKVNDPIVQSSPVLNFAVTDKELFR